jgi:hypothetical protein
MAAQPSGSHGLFGNTMATPSASQTISDDFETFKTSLDSKILTIFVNPRRQKTHIHWIKLQKAVPIVHDLSFFKRYSGDATIDESTKTTYPSKDDPAAFELFCFWLYRNHFRGLTS